MNLPAILVALVPGAAAGQVVINEIHYAPPDKTLRQEFLELHNAGAGPVEVGGWRVTGGVFLELPPGTSIPAGGYLVLAQDPAALAARFPGTAALGPFVGRLGSDGEELVLRDATGARVDEVEYGRGFPWPTAGGSGGQSIELLSPSLDNQLGGSWRISDPGAGTAETLVQGQSIWRYLKGTAEASVPGDAWRNAGFDDSSWLEGAGALGYGEAFITTSLADMRGSYSSLYLRKTFQVGDPGAIGRLVLEAQVDDGFNAWINGVHVARHNLPADELAHDGVASAALEDLGFQPFELALAPGLLVAGDNVLAIQLHNSSLGDSSDAFWDAHLIASSGGVGPTPGRANAVLTSNAPPQLRQVEHTPREPHTGDPVIITVKATDPEGVVAVTLEYQVVLPGQYVRLGDAAYQAGWTELQLRDDGVAPDLTPGDAIFTCELPAAAVQHRRLIRYRIHAEDALGARVTVPYADDPQPNFALLVHDGIPAWKGSRQPGVAPVVTYGLEVMRQLPAYHLIALEDDVLKCQYDSAYRNSRFQGTLVHEGKVYDHIEFSIRGEASTYVSGKNKWRLHFTRGHDLEARDDFGRKRKAPQKVVNLSPCSTPWVPPNRGMAGLDEAVGFRAYELCGVLSPRTSYLQLRVIDEAIEAHATDQYRGDLWGLYLTNEHTDGAFLEERGLPDGNTYKIEGGGGVKRNQGPTQPTTTADYDTYRNGFNSAQPLTWWRSNTDLAGYYAFRAGDRFLNNMDLRDGWNHCQYHDPVTGRWTAIPWDIDMLYMPVTHWPGYINVQNAILQHAALMLEYRDRAREIQDLFLTEDQFGALVDELAAFVSRPGAAQSFASVDEAMWNYHPRTAGGHRGYFYRNPASQGFIGGTATRTLVTPDHAGMARYLKDFVLTGYGWGRIEEEAADAATPDRPTISSAGPQGFPADAISFASSAFSDPQGPQTFAAVRWRVAEVTPPGPPSATAPRRYEIEPTWESGEVAPGVLSVTLPPLALRVGSLHRARVKHRDTSGRWSRWSEPLEFVVGPPTVETEAQRSLRVTEVHFHPAGDLREEFIELLNIGNAPVDLSDLAFTGGIELRFRDGAVAALQPGERLVVVESLEDFRARHGTTGILVAGEYSGRLANSGERIVLTQGANLPIQDFTFEDVWHPEADGEGYSLEVVDPLAPLQAWSEPGGWRASAIEGGTPGAAGGGPPPGGRRIPGDSNESGALELGDAVSLLFRLFVGGVAPPCEGADLQAGGNLALLDVNGSGAVNLTDAVTVLNYLFLGGAPPAPGVQCVRLQGCSDNCPR